MSMIKLDDAGQEVREGDLIYIVVTVGDSKSSRFARIIRIDTAGIHYISQGAGWRSQARKSVNPSYFCRCESTAKSKPFEEQIDTYYAEWIKKHKEFQ